MRLPFISIIIPTRNEEKSLPRLLKSISRLDYPKNKFEVIIIDGNSTDKTVDIAKKFQVKVLCNPKLIRGAGCQIGIDYSKGELLAFTDADCVVPKYWLHKLVEALSSNPKIGSVGGANITPQNDTSFAKAVGDVLDVLTLAGSRYGLQNKKIVETFHNPGCNVLYKKEVVLEAGGFNPELLTCEDEELDFRLREKGYKLFFTPMVSVDHYRRSTLKKVFIQSYRFAIGRVEAAKLHWPKMHRWFHFSPSLLILSLVISAIFPKVAFVYLGIVLISSVFLVTYLSLIKKNGSPVTYFLIFWSWVLGWGIGFIVGFLKGFRQKNPDDQKIKNTWGSYWKSYRGATKIGAWSQNKSLNVAIRLMEDKGLNKKIKIIDVGVGEGRTLGKFRKCGYKNSLGIDNTQESLKLCQRNGLKLNHDVFLIDILNSNFKDREFDLVFSEGLLEHFKDPLPVIYEMSRISGRYILLIQPNHFSLYGLLIAILGNLIRGNVKEYTFTKNFFIKKFRENGFYLKAEKYTSLGEFFVLLFQRQLQ